MRTRAEILDAMIATELEAEDRFAARWAAFYEAERAANARFFDALRAVIAEFFDQPPPGADVPPSRPRPVLVVANDAEADRKVLSRAA